MSFMTEAQRLKKIGQLQAKLARQVQTYKDTEAELAYWTNLELPIEQKKGPAK